MRNIFVHTSAHWVRYGDYEWKKADEGLLYLMPAPDAVPEFYDPMQVVNELVGGGQNRSASDARNAGA